MRKYAEEYRERLLVKFSRKNTGKKPPEVLEAEKVIAKYRKEQEEVEPTLSRLNSLECPDSVCPDCLWTKGRTVHVKPISSSNCDIDLFRCPECNRTYEEHA
jgi:hypothetical protein